SGRAMGEVARAVSDVAAGAQRQVAMLEEARSLTAETGEVAGQARTLARSGMASAEDASAAMHELRASTAGVAATMRTLEERSQRIAASGEAIGGSAAQTHLVALDPSDQAAPAR